MNVFDKIFATLTALTSETKALCNGRVYAVTAPQGSIEVGEYVVYQQIGSSPFETHGTSESAEDTQDECLVQFSCYARTAKLARALRRAVRNDLLVPGVMEGVKVASPDEREADEPAINAKRADLDLSLFHDPSTV